jgi:hypothetical protein
MLKILKDFLISLITDLIFKITVKKLMCIAPLLVI